MNLPTRENSNFCFPTFRDDDPLEPGQKQNRNESSLPGPPVGPNPFLDIPQNIAAVEYKKGYVMRKCCYDSNNKKSKFESLESSKVHSVALAWIVLRVASYCVDVNVRRAV